MPTYKNLPLIFEYYINNQMPTNDELIEMKKVTFTITQEEALEDLRIFQYVLDSSYSGREYWENQGVDFGNIYNNIRTYINSHESIFKQDMFNLYNEQLQGIHDGHLELLTYGRCVDFGKKYKVYFADILLEKDNYELVVIFSNVAEISVGSRFTSQQLEGKIFKTLSPSGKEHYLLGCRSWSKVDSLEISYNGKVIGLPTHPCKASYFQQDDIGVFKKDNIKGFNVVTSSRFMEWDDKIAQDFYNCGMSLRNENVLIWNLLGNSGGNSNYPLQFIKGLNEYSFWKIDCAELKSPSISQASGVPYEDIGNNRDWMVWNAGERDTSKGVFNGTLYILANDEIISSGESALNIAKSVRNSIIVGQNSSGVGVFGDVRTYQLPYSDIRMRVPSKLFLGGAKEGEGFEPDYWIDNTDVQGELISWLKNPSSYQALR
jgi:hypothetical protein